MPGTDMAPNRRAHSSWGGDAVGDVEVTEAIEADRNQAASSCSVLAAMSTAERVTMRLHDRTDMSGGSLRRTSGAWCSTTRERSRSPTYAPSHAASPQEARPAPPGVALRRGDVVGDLCLIERALEPKSEHGGGLVTSLYGRPAEVAARARLLAA